MEFEVVLSEKLSDLQSANLGNRYLAAFSERHRAWPNDFASIIQPVVGPIRH
jgi:hypothetical protein